MPPDQPLRGACVLGRCPTTSEGIQQMCDDLPTSENLLGAFYGCDQNAFNVLVQRYEKRLARLTTNRLYASLRVAAAKALHLDLVTDVVQNIFLKVSRTKNKPSGRWRGEVGKVEPWLFTICRNMTKDFVDKLDQQRQEVSLPDDSASVTKDPTNQQDKEMFWDCVDSLPEDHRNVILLKYRYKMQQTDIAQRLNKSNAWVSKIHVDALKLLKKNWEMPSA